MLLAGMFNDIFDGDDHALFCSTMPSQMAVTDVFKAPMSTTSAVALLCEYL